MTARGIFVTGTDTGVGKTVAAAVLVRKLDGDYWKPVQTGLADEPGDSATVADLAQLPRARVHAPRYALAAPLAPLYAAERENIVISPHDFALPATPRALVVEGAGGVLVPLCASHLMTDLIRQLGLPAVVVARTSLGTINHTLLTLAALRARSIDIAGVLFVGDENPGNQRAIASWGEVTILGRVPILSPLDAPSVARAADAIAYPL